VGYASIEGKNIQPSVQISFQVDLVIGKITYKSPREEEFENQLALKNKLLNDYRKRYEDFEDIMPPHRNDEYSLFGLN